MSLFKVYAEFPGGGIDSNACCFDPRVVMTLLRKEFAELLESDFEDLSWKDHKGFLAMRDAEGDPERFKGVIRIAKNDAMRRGPIFRLQIRWEGETYSGHAERYRVQLSSLDVPIPEALLQRFGAFLKKLPLVPFEVRAVKIDGNTYTDFE